MKLSLLYEAVRSLPSTKFNWNEFKKLKSEHLRYARKTLKLLGEGSSRRTYLFSSHKVLKIAKNDAGRAQNKTEVEVFTNPQVKDITTKIFEYDDNYQWILSELVKPVGEYGLSEWLGFTSLPTSDLLYIILPYKYDYPKNTQVTGVDLINKLIKDKHGEKSDVFKSQIYHKLVKFIRQLSKFVEATNMHYADLYVDDHYGFAPDGRLVVLDYGLSENTYDSYYADSRPTSDEDWVTDQETNTTSSNKIDSDSNMIDSETIKKMLSNFRKKAPL